MAVDTTQIVPLSADMTGPDFIDQLNVNLNLAAQSSNSEEQPGNRGSNDQEEPSGIEKTISLQLQWGGLATEDSGSYDKHEIVTRKGYVERYLLYNNPKIPLFRKSCHTILMIGIENCTVTDIKREGSETVKVFYYDSNFECKGYESGTDVQTILNNVKTQPKEDRCYIKIALSKNTNYSTLRNLEVTVEGEYTLVKNKTPQAGCAHYFTFATGYPSKAETETAANRSYLGTVVSENENGNITYYQKNSDTICCDNGYIALPPNYNQEGAPVPLVVYCHGTGGFQWDQKTKVSEKVGRTRMFLANNGYAVCDCSHLTNIHTEITESKQLPSIVSTTASLIRFIQMNYNVETDGIYIVGKSAGGFVCMLLPQIEGFRVKAAAGLSPTTSGFMQFYPGKSLAKDETTSEKFRNAHFEQYGITTVSDTNNETDITNDYSYTAYVNASKIRRHDPFFKSANISTEELQTLIKYWFKSGKSNLVDFIDAAKNAVKYHAQNNIATYGYMNEDDGRNVLEIINKIKITIDCPIKIWQSVNDASVSCKMSELFIEWCKKGGTSAYFRKLPPNNRFKKGTAAGYPTGGGSDGDSTIIVAHNLVDEINESGTMVNAIETQYRTKYTTICEGIEYGGVVTETVAVAEMVDFFNQW